jgi:hypothetical protein
VRLNVLCGGIPDKPCTQDCKLRSQVEDFWKLPGRCQLRTMCGSRTGGWSLPGVMSD